MAKAEASYHVTVVKYGLGHVKEYVEKDVRKVREEKRNVKRAVVLTNRARERERQRVAVAGVALFHPFAAVGTE